MSLFRDSRLYRKIWRAVRSVVADLIENPSKSLSEIPWIWDKDCPPGLSQIRATRENGYILVSFKVDPFRLIRDALTK